MSLVYLLPLPGTDIDRISSSAAFPTVGGLATHRSPLPLAFHARNPFTIPIDPRIIPTTSRTKREEPVEDKPRRAPPPRSRAPSRRAPEIDEVYRKKVDALKESFKATLFDEKKKEIIECGVAELAKTLEAQKAVATIVFDGVVTQRLVDIAVTKKTTLLVGAAVADLEERPRGMTIVTFEDLS